MKNYVQIQTSERSGSGVILSCEIDQKKWGKIKKDEKSYIVLTNYHVIQDIKQDGRDKKRNVRLKIMDIHGDEIEQKMIQHIYVESGNNYDHASDVAALLVIIKECCEIPYCNDIYMGDHSKEKIEIYGYPHIFQSNWINQDICMEGIIQKYMKDGIGLYTIKDDYHSYSNISDKNLMDGISGAPVYLTADNNVYLVGINESVCNIGEGNNPFKMVYFLSIDRVLDWLAEQHIIIYQYGGRSVKVIWIKTRFVDLGESDETKPEDKAPLLNLEKPRNIVLVGSSGAGKSSVLKTLCQHGNQFSSVGDGQTTRDTIVYHLDINEKDPRVEISFLSKKDFIDNRLKKVRLKRYGLILCQIYGMEKSNIVANPCCYLQDMLMPLQILRKNTNELTKQKIDALINQINQIGYSFQLENDEEDLESKLLNLYEASIVFLKEFFDEQPEYKNLKKAFWNRKKYEAYRTNNTSKEMDFYYMHLMKSNEEAVPYEEDALKKELKQILTIEDGFYNISEFYHVDEKEETEKEWDAIFDNHFLHDMVLIPFEDFIAEQDIDLEEETEEKQENQNCEKIPTFLESVKAYYGEIYETIKKKLVYKEIDITKNLNYSLVMLTSKEKNIIARCMRKVGKESLTSIVSAVNVYDRISNTYVYEIYRYKVNCLQIYDTCGYDHIERQNLNVYFRTLFNKIKVVKKDKNGNERHKKHVDAIIYVKKLDSEKPTELEKMLPIINSMEETTPIFCLFTALDQYIDMNKNSSYDILWDRAYYEKWKNMNSDEDYIFPKSVQNIHENEKLRDLLYAPEYMKDKIIDFLRNHMVPYSSQYQVNDENVIKLNRNSISYLLRSMLRDEWNSGFVVTSKNTELSEECRKINVTDEDVKKAIRLDLERMFTIASRTNWEQRHPSTARANFRRIYRYDQNYDKKEEDLGFNRTSIDRWDNLLDEGYSKSFLSSDSNTIKTLSEKHGLSKVKAYEIIASLKQKIIGDSMGKWAGKEEGVDFRYYFKELYKKVEINYCNHDQSETKKIDIFQRQDKITIERSKQIDFLNQVCDFKGMLVKNGNIEEEMINYIKTKIDEEFMTNNDNYLNKLYEYDERFRDGIDYIDSIIRSHVDDSDLKTSKLILKILENWSSKWPTPPVTENE